MEGMPQVSYFLHCAIMTKLRIIGWKLNWNVVEENFWIDIQTEKNNTDKLAFCSISYICIDLYITHLLLTQSVIKQRNMAEIFVKIYIRWEKKKKKNHKRFNMPLDVDIKRKK